MILRSLHARCVTLALYLITHTSLIDSLALHSPNAIRIDLVGMTCIARLRSLMLFASSEHRLLTPTIHCTSIGFVPTVSLT